MWKKLINIINNPEDELKERMLRSIILVGEAACIFASVEIFLVMDVNAVMLSIIMAMILFMIGIFFITFRFQKYELAATLLGFVIVFLVMPPQISSASTSMQFMPAHLSLWAHKIPAIPPPIISTSVLFTLFRLSNGTRSEVFVQIEFIFSPPL